MFRGELFWSLQRIPGEREDGANHEKGEDMKQMLAIGLLGAIFVTGCGGGGSNGGDSGTSAEGLWNGTTSNGRAMSGLVLDDGTYWVLYSLMGNSAVIAGGVQGTGSSRNGTFTSSNGRDFNLEGLGVNDVDVSANYVMQESLSGSLRYRGTGEVVSFSASYDASYELTPSLELIAGTYSGSAATSGGTEFATVTVSTSGAISGSSAGGCTYSGTGAPRARGNVYDVVVTFNGGLCALGTQTVRGAAYFDADLNQLVSAAVNTGRTDGFIFAGIKP